MVPKILLTYTGYLHHVREVYIPVGNETTADMGWVSLPGTDDREPLQVGRYLSIYTRYMRRIEKETLT